MFLRNAVAAVAHGYRHFAGVRSVPARGKDPDFDRRAVPAVLDRIFEQVAGDTRYLIFVSGNIRRLKIVHDDDRAPKPFGNDFHRIDDAPHRGVEFDPAGRRPVLFHLDVRQRQQRIDQPRHARRLLVHDAEEAFLGLRIVRGRPPQGFEKAGQRGERCAQFVGDVGDQIDPHPVGLDLGGHVAHENQRPVEAVLRFAGRFPEVGRAVLRRLAR